MPDTSQYTFAPRKAKREGVGLFIGVAGGTGSGKTYSALRLARGIVGPKGRILAGDSEGKRMTHYDRQFDFDVVDLKPPFRPGQFEALAKYAEDNGYGVLIIDSFSHEWAGDGGVLEWHDEIQGGDERRNFVAWIDPKAAHKSMVNSFLQRTIPIIFCMRAEEKIRITGGRPEPLGWMPIVGKNFEYELTTLITLSNENPGCVSYKMPRKIQVQHLPMFPDGEFITEESGRLMAAWARGDDLVDKIVAIADGLIARFTACKTADEVEAILGEELVVKQMKWMEANRPDQYKRLPTASSATEGPES